MSVSVSVAKLRVWLLVGAGLLVLVIGAFLGYAHWRGRLFIHELPKKLGMDIQQETTGFTYSQSAGATGKTIYTIHASKAVQHKDGKVNLRDVGIVLYGQGQGNEKRVDRIYGNEFEYDQNAGVIRGIGEVHIDLQAPAPADADKAEYAKGHDEHPEAKDERLIHVKTSELVFLQKLGTAATDQGLEFEYDGMIGHAHGAEYNTDTGLLVLQSAVTMNGVKQGKPVLLTADHAELDRQQEQLFLTRAEYTVVSAEAGKRVTKGGRVTAFLRKDGSVEHAVGLDGVSMTDDSGATMTAARGEVHLNGASQPQTGMLSGNVRYTADDPLQKTSAETDEGKADFDKAGLLKHVLMTGAVHVHERTRVGDAVQVVSGREVSRQELWSERDLVSKTLDLNIATGSDRRMQLRQARAEGSARLTVVNPPAAEAKSGHKGATTSVMSGDVLTADFVMRDGESHVKSVHGVGHTVLHRVSDTGATATSLGETLEAEFRSVVRSDAGATQRLQKNTSAAKVGGKGALTGQGGDEIATAVQLGHVMMTNLPVAKPGVATGAAAGGGEQRATADRAAYDGSSQKLTLTGTVQVSDTDSTVWADRVVMEQETGDAQADGSVRASYMQPRDADAKSESAAEPVHVLAMRGEFKHDAGLAKFYGGTGAGGRPARLWQGESQVEASVLEFEQRERRMLAHGDGREAGMVVHAVFVSAASPDSGGSAKPADKGSKPVPVRVASHEMRYDDVARRADFTGGVRVDDADGTMRSQQAVVYLKAADSAKTSADAKKGAAVQTGFMGGSVDRMVATGGVEVVQPGKRAIGEQLVYTASDGMFVMTGSPGVPPKMMDEAQGTITGASLRFHAGDNSVVVSNGPDAGSGQRVRTETRVKQQL
jgi:lipopolysaccharide export system protein LptA